MTEERGLGVLAITHYARVLTELRADRVHVLMAGRVVTSGGPELADELERAGYEGLAEKLGVDALAVETTEEPDPFKDTTTESSPFADPLA
jgi:Fe-S cluster assembly ATP-binding protein